jgi:transposase
MSYRVEQCIGKTVYVYDVTSYWDPQKHQSRQRRAYLGKKDPTTGELIPPRHSHSPRCAKDYGNFYLLRQMAHRSGLTAVLRQVFSQEAETLLALACFEVAEAAPLYLFPHWAEATALDHAKPLSSPDLTNLTQCLGRMESEREEFFRGWITQCGPVPAVVFDITSLSSYSNLLNEVEWGYNRDHDLLPQVNIGMVYAEHDQIPLYYHLYPGSIRDVATLPNMTLYLDAFALTPTLFVMDRGFYSQANVAALTRQSCTFLMPLPRSVALFDDLLAQHYQILTALPNSRLFQDEILGYVQTSIPLNLAPVFAHLYFDPVRAQAQALRFLTPLWKAEKHLQGTTFHQIPKAQRALAKQVSGAGTFFRFIQTDDHVDISRDALALTRRLTPMGMTILLTNSQKLDGVRALQWYRQKDVVEKSFDVLKHELDGQRLRGHSTEAITGRLFLKFLSLIIHAELTKAMRAQHMFADYSMRELLYELKKIRLVEMKSGKQVLTEISKRQRKIFKTLDIFPK